MTVDAIEFIWIVLNGATFVATVIAWREARRDQRLVKLKNGRVREIATAGHVRREVVRACIQLVLLALVLPSLANPAPVRLTPGVVALMTVALLIFLNTVGDLRDMRRITAELYRDLARSASPMSGAR